MSPILASGFHHMYCPLLEKFALAEPDVRLPLLTVYFSSRIHKIAKLQTPFETERSSQSAIRSESIVLRCVFSSTLPFALAFYTAESTLNEIGTIPPLRTASMTNDKRFFQNL